jgi:hypothetical protein
MQLAAAAPADGNELMLGGGDAILPEQPTSSAQHPAQARTVVCIRAGKNRKNKTRRNGPVLPNTDGMRTPRTGPRRAQIKFPQGALAAQQSNGELRACRAAYTGVPAVMGIPFTGYGRSPASMRPCDRDLIATACRKAARLGRSVCAARSVLSELRCRAVVRPNLDCRSARVSRSGHRREARARGTGG